VTRHVGDAISDRTLKAKNKIVAIGIAPWGIVENKDDLVGKDVTVPYHCVASPKTNYSVLNSNHSCFLLVDNGTVGKYGGEIIFRKRLERYIAHQKISITSCVKGRGVPVICVVLEGGANTIRSVLDYITDTPPVPVVVCDGSGRAADLLAFTHKYSNDDATMPESLHDQLLLTIQKTFQYTLEQAEKLFIELMLCVKKKELITVFRMGEGAQDIDLAILTALLKGTNASAPDQLSLALTWDRVDIARSHIFVYGQEWPEGSLEQAMMDALINDRVDFVKLLLENGVHMQTFLTIPRLEELYNTRQGPSNTLRYLIRDVRKHVSSGYKYTLLDIGLVLQHLMGGAFRATYCRKRFRQKYHALKRSGTSGNIGQLVTTLPNLVDTKQAEELFPYPFHDLMIWAVLMKRQKMAHFMWQHGEEAMAKALMACKLYKGMAHEADQDDLEVEIPDELRKYAQEFQKLALDLLEHCYKIDDDYTQQLLTYELKNFSDQTCLSLAVAASHREFIAHTCCQILLNDMWMGGLRMRKSTSLKVIVGILIPPYILAMEFKSKEELQLMPQTMEEHLDELEDSESDKEDVSVSSFEDEQDEFHEEVEISNVSQTQAVTKENGNVKPLENGLYSSDHVFKKKKSPLRLGKKIYEFYNAPITKFWAHTMAYIIFLLMFTLLALEKALDYICWTEIYVMTYIFTLACEKFRQVIASEPVRFTKKVQVFFSDLWNLWDTIAILLFSSGAVLRVDPGMYKATRVIYAVNIVFWYMRMLEILSVNKYLGPYVKIIGKLVRDMSYFIIILLIVLMSFGIVRQSIHYQDKEMPLGRRFRNVFFYPYWMIYGELFAEEIDTCTDTINFTDCVYGSWISPTLMCLYLLAANILLVNLLIARFNATFIRNNVYSREIWKFQRYQLIINYELRPILPPPLIIFSLIYLSLKFIKRRCQRKRDFFDNGLKLFLSHDDMEKLHDFEEECAEDYFREKEHQFQASNEERIRAINERSENMVMKVDDVNQKENSIKLSLQTVDYRLSKLEEIAIQNAEMLNMMQAFMSKSGIRSRHVSVSSDRSRRESQESSVETLDLPQYYDQSGLPQSVEAGVEIKLPHNMTTLDATTSAMTNLDASSATMRSVPSPMFIHSARAVKEDHFQRLTDKSPVKARGLLERARSMKNRRSLPRVHESAHEPDHVLERSRSESPAGAPYQSLLEKRYGPHHLQIDTKPATPNLSDNLSSPEAYHVCLPEDKNYNNTNNSKPVYSTAKLESDTHVSTVQQGINENENLQSCFGDTTPSSQQTDSNFNDQSDSFLPSVTSYVSDLAASSRLPTSVVTPFTPILTPLRAEYTTITDEIDTTCTINRTPPRSPTATGSFFGESKFFPDWEEERDETEACKMEKATLKQAEEVEHRKMEKVIRYRLRQISLDESDSISDIAKLVISEMDNSEGRFEHEDDDDVNNSVEQVDQGEETMYCDQIQIRIRRASEDTESQGQAL
ncbi:hypothetical protein ACJMK2_043048, partial [Sinanodonta woodiana]